MSLHLKTLFLFVAASFGTIASSQIVFGQVDTFEDGTLMAWEGANPENIPTGGPGGAGDHFMRLTSVGGSGPSSRLAVRNTLQWSGNYLTAGVDRVTFHMLYLGTEVLSMRAVLWEPATTQFTSTVPIMISASAEWQTLSFDLRESALTRVAGSATYNEVITGASQLMFRHQSGGPSSAGTPIATTAGFDNIAAVPEPGTIFALLGGVAILALRFRRD